MARRVSATQATSPMTFHAGAESVLTKIEWLEHYGEIGLVLVLLHLKDKKFRPFKDRQESLLRKLGLKNWRRMGIDYCKSGNKT